MKNRIKGAGRITNILAIVGSLFAACFIMVFVAGPEGLLVIAALELIIWGVP